MLKWVSHEVHLSDTVFMHLLAISASSLEKCLFKSFLMGLFVLLLLSCKSSFYVLDTDHLSDIHPF